MSLGGVTVRKLYFAGSNSVLIACKSLRKVERKRMASISLVAVFADRSATSSQLSSSVEKPAALIWSKFARNSQAALGSAKDKMSCWKSFSIVFHSFALN